MSSHAGTHVDAPSHVLADGAGVDSLAMELLMGSVTVLDFPFSRPICARDLEPLSITSRVLFKTPNSLFWERLLKAKSSHSTPQAFSNWDFVALTSDAARYLVDHGTRTVGIDGPSIDLASQSDLPTHHILLEAGGVIIESLNLSGVEPGVWDLCCLPLRVAGADGAPARALLLR